MSTILACYPRNQTLKILISVSGNAGCIVLLAQAGADVNVTDAHGAYPIHYAANMARDVEKLPEDAPVVSTHSVHSINTKH